MAWDILFVAAGLGILLLAGDALVKGAVNLSLRLGVPAAIVGLTIVAFGTSAPELLVSVQAVLADVPALALGNVVGSNIANVLLVLGVPALIAAVPVARGEVAHDYIVMMLATALFVGLALLGPIGWPQGLILLAGLALMLGDAYRRARAERRAGAEPLPEGADPALGGWRIGLFTGIGLVGLPLGAGLLVDGATGIARTLGVTEAVIGLTLVAVGTSLPELATTVMAAVRRQAGVAMGNVLGSNVFNLLGIVGVAGLVGTMPVPPEMLARDLWVMVAAAALLGVFVATGWSIGRLAGIGLVLLYGAYLAVLALGGGMV
ncbi:calcium/sodium antiporter [Rhodobaculum claviforme]|uniref:Sodium:proton exchanger n=1 Tax=Rhodobaculum claviforme TaxID=1549854 RepID=A0A934TNA8_9RHOB|nr:calcium/sodium antiporter [Rhodobaculum claviforme]MBK5928233.1 sodium:proton exchanger [Rhodobaculum claviforme]